MEAKGKGKVLLFNADDVKIGETFFRRAAQLVRQQKAEWADDSCEAIRFYKGMENTDASSDVSSISPHMNGFLSSEFDRQIKERAKFVIHSFMLVPGIIMLLPASYVISMMLMDMFFQRDAVGVGAFLDLAPILASILATIVVATWVTAYAIHAYLYFTNKRARTRIAKKLNMELV